MKTGGRSVYCAPCQIRHLLLKTIVVVKAVLALHHGLRSPLLAVLLHGSRAVGASQTLRR